MKILTILLALLFIDTPILLREKDKPELEGSWKLKKYKYGNDEEFSEVPSFMTYVKNITPNHFSWCSYNPEDGKIIGTGGGTYEYNKTNYIEKSDYWYPAGSGIAGTATSFEYSLKGKQWTIKGYIKNLNLNPSSGEFEKIDSTYMVEIWQKLD